MNSFNLLKSDERIYIAGHRGMVGSAIWRALKRSGYGDFEKGGELLGASRSELDLLDLVAVKEWFHQQKPTVVVLAAAKVGGIQANQDFPVDFLLENIKIQNNLIETAWRSGVRRLLFLGSSCIYPKFANQPISEDALMTGALEVTNEPYAIAKIAGIKLCEALRNQFGFDAISLMPTNLYGPGDNYHLTNSHVLPALIRRFSDAVVNGEDRVTCWGSGSPRREFLHVDDLGEACVFVLEHWQPKSNERQFLNVGTGLDLTIKELAEVVASCTGFKGQIYWDSTKPDGTPRKQLDVSRLQKIGWKAKIPLLEGIKSTVKLFENEIRK